MWKEVTNDDNGLKKFVEIQRTMGGVYLDTTFEYLKRRIAKKSRDWHFFIYDDGDYEITLGFYYNESKDKIKVAYGGIGKYANFKIGVSIAAKKIKEYLASKGKEGYTILNPDGLEPKAILCYREILAEFRKEMDCSKHNLSGNKDGYEFKIKKEPIRIRRVGG
jgi:hypothetical protein